MYKGGKKVPKTPVAHFLWLRGRFWTIERQSTAFGGGGTYESIRPHACSDRGDETH